MRYFCPQMNERQQRKPVIDGIKERRRSSECPNTKIGRRKSQYLQEYKL